MKMRQNKRVLRKVCYFAMVYLEGLRSSTALTNAQVKVFTPPEVLTGIPKEGTISLW